MRGAGVACEGLDPHDVEADETYVDGQAAWMVSGPNVAMKLLRVS